MHTSEVKKEEESKGTCEKENALEEEKQEEKLNHVEKKIESERKNNSNFEITKRARGRPKKTEIIDPKILHLNTKKIRGRPKKYKEETNKLETENQSETAALDKKNIATYRAGGSDYAGMVVPEGSGKGFIYAYLRRSVEDRSGKPLEVQMEMINNYVHSKFPHEEVNEYFCDNGVGGNIEASERPAFKKCLETIKKSSNKRKQLIHLVVYDVSRLARTLTIGANIGLMLTRIGARLHLAQLEMEIVGHRETDFYGISLQLAESERTQAIMRIRGAYHTKTNWHPNKSYGTIYNGKGKPSTIVPEEKAILSEIRVFYEKDGLPVSMIAKKIQKKHGPRMLRFPPSVREKRERENSNKKETKNWDVNFICFLARKNQWKWGGENTLQDLEDEINAILSERPKTSAEEVFARKKGTLYDGVKINLQMIRKFMLDEQEPWRQDAYRCAEEYMRHEKYSNDDIVKFMNEEAPYYFKTPTGEIKTKEWNYKTALVLIKRAKKKIEVEKRNDNQIKKKS